MLTILINKYAYLKEAFNYSSSLVEDVINFNSDNVSTVLQAIDMLDEVFFSLS